MEETTIPIGSTAGVQTQGGQPQPQGQQGSIPGSNIPVPQTPIAQAPQQIQIPQNPIQQSQPTMHVQESATQQNSPQVSTNIPQPIQNTQGQQTPTQTVQTNVNIPQSAQAIPTQQTAPSGGEQITAQIDQSGEKTHEEEIQEIIAGSQELSLDDILTYVNNTKAISDVHLSGNEYVCFRSDGDIIKQTDSPKLDMATMKKILLESFNHDVQKFHAFMKAKDEDYGYMSKEGIPYRVNAFMRLNQIGIVMRKINGKALPLDILLFPETAQAIKDKILVRKKGLYLVTGPTGSGKSTSLVAMMELMNQTREEHIITMEDPIEFIFEPKQCTISQRNIGIDTNGFKNALRAAMREDPDIIFVGEIRDMETAEAALNMAETGHFVFSTLHTSSAAATINRYISFFPPEIQESVCDRLATALAGVQSQMLVHKIGGGRVGIYEFMVNNTAIRNNIKKREIPQINNTIETSSQDGMISMRAYAEKCIDLGLVSEESVQFIFAESGS